jgi:hypothetical protein
VRCLIAAVLAAAWPATATESVFKDFVTVQGDALREGDRPFRFLSFNIPNLHLVEDNMVFETDNVTPERTPKGRSEKRRRSTGQLGTVKLCKMADDGRSPRANVGIPGKGIADEQAHDG